MAYHSVQQNQQISPGRNMFFVLWLSDMYNHDNVLGVLFLPHFLFCLLWYTMRLASHITCHWIMASLSPPPPHCTIILWDRVKNFIFCWKFIGIVLVYNHEILVHKSLSIIRFIVSLSIECINNYLLSLLNHTRAQKIQWTRTQSLYLSNAVI